MANDVGEVVTTLASIQAGANVSFEQVQGVRWEADAELDLFLQHIYRELQMFASDEDIRSRELEYDRSWRARLSSLADELRKRMRAEASG